MASALAAADLVVARAGATSIAEITTVGVPAILVPYPYATDDHQTLNARALEAAGAAVVIRDADLDGDMLTDGLLALLSDPERRARMAAAARKLGRPDAAERVTALARDSARR
jgi:UDP-N-acetylglucosamine--N-acetylmuramyl-(pentapeptide) pyrophosphoryl-undecaprenol N-acetylglucosamine transferase